jgi:hypothetical protein
MDAVDDRQNGTSLLPGHQDLTPNSDATRLRLDHPTCTGPNSRGPFPGTHGLLTSKKRNTMTSSSCTQSSCSYVLSGCT